MRRPTCTPMRDIRILPWHTSPMPKRKTMRLSHAEEHKRRLAAVALFKQGFTASEVATIIGVARQTASRWLSQWTRERSAAFRHAPRTGAKAKLSRRRRKLVEALLLEGPEACGYPDGRLTLHRVAQLIERRFGINYSVSHVRQILLALGWQYRRTSKPTATDASCGWVAPDSNDPDDTS